MSGKFIVEIKEVLVKHVVVEADSVEQAEDCVRQLYNGGEIVLDYANLAEPAEITSTVSDTSNTAIDYVA
ncbi:MAG: DpnD/PcfM family protein [Aminipila sp.]